MSKVTKVLFGAFVVQNLGRVYIEISFPVVYFAVRG